MKRFTSAALVLGTLMALAPVGAFAREFDYHRRDVPERVVVRERAPAFEHARAWHEYARPRLDRCR